jgi:hypothetical protein
VHGGSSPQHLQPAHLPSQDPLGCVVPYTTPCGSNFSSGCSGGSGSSGYSPASRVNPSGKMLSARWWKCTRISQPLIGPWGFT